MIDNDILNQKVILMIGQYGSDKTTFLSQIYDFLMNFEAIQDIDIQNERVAQLLRTINFNDYEVIFIQGSGDKDFAELLYRSLLSLIQNLNLNLTETDFKIKIERSLELLLNRIKEINSDTSLLILLDEFEFLIKDNKSSQINLQLIQKLVDFIHANTGLKLIISSQTDPEFERINRDRIYYIYV